MMRGTTGRLEMMLAATGAVLLLLAVYLAIAASPALAEVSCDDEAGTTTCNFGETGAEDTFTVPEGVQTIHVVAAGAPGARGSTGYFPGIGARVTGDLAVTPGQPLYVNVGGTPTRVGCTVSDVACAGGFNGGGSSRYGGGGGGASDVRTTSRDQSGSLSSRLIVAAGGGGSGAGIACPLSPFPIVLGGAGGNAGSDGGDARPCYDYYDAGSGGGAGGQDAGGAGGVNGTGGLFDGENGSLGSGGDGGSFPGGGGGGGYYGGGGGSGWTLELIDHQLRQVVPGSGGGGGSNLVPAGGSARISGGPFVEISYETPNQAPTASDDDYSTDEDTVLTVDPSGVLSNDMDSDGDPLSASLVSTPEHARSFALEPDGSFSYAPAGDYHGRDSFTYETGDGKAVSEPATVYITVRSVNDAPVAREDSATADEDGFIDIPVLDNDSDVDGDALTAYTSTQPAHGTVTENADGMLRYAPDANYNGTDSFTYKANDGTEDSSATTVTVTVNPVNDAPTISVLSGSGSQSACLGDASGRITIELGDVDDAAATLAFTATSSNTRLVPNNQIALSGSGGTRTATITTISGRTGTSTLTITVGDGRVTSNAKVTVQAAGNGDDTLEGTGGPDLLLGQNGDDTVYGLDGSDVLCGNNGDDRLVGGGGADSFDGGSGRDDSTDFDAGQGDVRKNIP